MSRDFEPLPRSPNLTGKSGATTEGYLIDLHLFAGWFEQTNDYPLAPDNLTPADVREYRQLLLSIHKVKVSTINRHLAVFHTYGLGRKVEVAGYSAAEI